MNNLFEMFSYSFMVRAIIVGILISLVSALIGVSLVFRRNSMIGDGLSHTAFGAFAVATALGFAPTWFALPVTLLASFLILHLSKNRRLGGDSAVAILSASSLAIGTLAISVTKGVSIDLNSYLFGSILSVGWGDVWLSVALAVVAVLLYIFAFHRIFSVTFDPEFARAIGVRTGLYDMLFSALCSVVVVVGMRLLGALLISSLIIFPALIATNFAKSFKKAVIFSAITSVVTFLVGLILSYLLSLPSGATIVLVNLLVLALAKTLQSPIVHKP